MLSAEFLPNMLSVNAEIRFNACNDELLSQLKSEGQDQPVHPHNLIWIFSGLFVCTTYILYTNH